MMVCQLCNEYPATIHITEIINGVKKELHVCSECGKKKGIVGKTVSFTIGDIVGGIIEEKSHGKIDALQEKTCPFCKSTFAKVRKIAKIGCATCLDTFGEWLDPFIEKIHGANEHVGRSPATITHEAQKELELARLRKRLAAAIKQEDYETAAEIRDRIKKIQSGG